MPTEIAAAGGPYQRQETGAACESVCAFGAWPSIPIKAVAGADDRFFPLAFQQRLARDRLQVTAEVLPGGHPAAPSQPEALTQYLLDH